MDVSGSQQHRAYVGQRECRHVERPTLNCHMCTLLGCSVNACISDAALLFLHALLLPMLGDVHRYREKHRKFPTTATDDAGTTNGDYVAACTADRTAAGESTTQPTAATRVGGGTGSTWLGYAFVWLRDADEADALVRTLNGHVVNDGFVLRLERSEGRRHDARAGPGVDVLAAGTPAPPTTLACGADPPLGMCPYVSLCACPCVCPRACPRVPAPVPPQLCTLSGSVGAVRVRRSAGSDPEPSPCCTLCAYQHNDVFRVVAHKLQCLYGFRPIGEQLVPKAFNAAERAAALARHRQHIIQCSTGGLGGGLGEDMSLTEIVAFYQDHPRREVCCRRWCAFC